MKRNILLAAVCGAVIITSCGKVEKPAEEREDCIMQEWKDFSFTCIKDGAPEECIADNFAYAMMNRTDLPNQELLEDILNLLKNNH